MKKFWIAAGTAAVLATGVFIVINFGNQSHSSGKFRPVSKVSTEPSTEPPVIRYDIPQPYSNCRGDDVYAGLGWTLYGWDSGEQTIEPWYPEVKRDVEQFAGGPLELKVAWYCPPR